MRIFWSEEEKIKLITLYEVEGRAPSEIALTLKRTKTSIKNKIRKLKLKHTSEQTSKIKSRLLSGMGNGMFGSISSNRGLTKENSERIRRTAKKQSIYMKKAYKEGRINVSGKNNPMYGKPSWSRGLTKYTSEILKNAGIKGSKTNKEAYKNLPEKEKNKIKKKMAYIGALCKKKKTSIEKIVANILNNLNLKYKWGYIRDTFVFDFYINNKLIVECQGDYWHANPLIYNENNVNPTQKNNIIRDKKKLEYLEVNKIPYLFFWENEIRSNPDSIMHKIEEALNDKPSS